MSSPRFRGCPNDHNAPINPGRIICQRRDQTPCTARAFDSLLRNARGGIQETWYTEVNRNSTTHAERRPSTEPAIAARFRPPRIGAKTGGRVPVAPRQSWAVLG